MGSKRRERIATDACCQGAIGRSLENDHLARQLAREQNVPNEVTACELPFPSASVVGGGPLFFIRVPPQRSV